MNVELEHCPKWHYFNISSTQVRFTPVIVFYLGFYEPWPLITPVMCSQWVFHEKPQVISQLLICSKYLIVVYNFLPFIYYGLFGVLCGTEPNTVGGLAHWIQTVYGESSSGDDTMWAACSSQNTNVPCESQKEEKVSLLQGQSSKHGCYAEREHLCFYQSSGTQQFDDCRNHIWLSANLMLHLQLWRNAPWLTQETAKSVTNMIYAWTILTEEGEQRVHESALLEKQTAANVNITGVR